MSNSSTEHSMYTRHLEIVPSHVGNMSLSTGKKSLALVPVAFPQTDSHFLTLRRPTSVDEGCITLIT